MNYTKEQIYNEIDFILGAPRDIPMYPEINEILINNGIDYSEYYGFIPANKELIEEIKEKLFDTGIYIPFDYK